MRAIPSDWREWFSTSLLPFKIYTVMAIIYVVGWQIEESRHLDRESLETEMGDFAYDEGSYIKLGYFLCSIVLILGGLIQFKFSRRASFFSVAFGIIAFSIGWFLQRYLDPALILF